MSLADIHTRAEKFQSRIRWRNWIEYAAGALVIGGFGWVAINLPIPIMQAACALVALGTVYVMWKLATIGGAKDDAASWADFHRDEMVRQRDALAGIWRWYLGPLVPGMVLFWIGVAVTPTDLPFPVRVVVSLIGLGFGALVFFGIADMNKRAAKTLQAEIDALDRARG